MKNLIVAAAFLSLARIESISPEGIPNGPQSVTVKYWIQPCNQQLVRVLHTPAPSLESPETSQPKIAVLVLVKDLGRRCMGPTMIKEERFVLPGGDEGYGFYPVQPAQ